MTKEEKLAVINSLTEKLNAYPHFYRSEEHTSELQSQR